MKLGYDNIEDAKSKLLETLCLYKGKAFCVKSVWEDFDKKDHYLLNGTNLIGRGNVEGLSINDKDFNCSNYNIGYANQAGLSVWFFRIPLKQYKQGLRYDQVQTRATVQQAHGIELKPGKHVGMMLENNYPTIDEVAGSLMAGDAQMLAFHRNFAMSRDAVHRDFILEYKGRHVGFSKDLKKFELLEEHQHLLEALKEAAA